MAITISQSGYDILGSGILHILEDEVTKVQIEDFTLLLYFVQKDGEDITAKYESVGDKEGKYTFTNFNDALGRGNVKPSPIAEKDGKNIYFVYRIFALDNSKIKTLEYTFYLAA
jgi:hypothetical protein